MNKYKVIIIEDETPARNLIRHFLEKHPQFEVVAECADGLEGARQISLQAPDLIFLDIRMPRVDGFEMLELFEGERKMPLTIFTTAYDEFAIKAFEYNTLDYLLKPISADRFDRAVEKAVGQLEKGIDGQEHIQKFLQHGETSPGFMRRIVVRAGSGIHVIPEGDVYCLEARDDYVLICTAKEEFLKRKTLKFFEDKLDSQNFLRVHRSFIVRIDAIRKIEPYSKDAYLAVLKNGRRVSVSKAGYSLLKNNLDF